MRLIDSRKKLLPFLTAAALLGAAGTNAAAQAVNINCGGPSMVASDGSTWLGDRYFTSGDLLYTSDRISGTADIQLYRSGRAGLYSDFSYSIPLANGSYSVTLDFAEIQYWNRGDRVFNVSINGSPVLTNFDILTHVTPRTVFVQQFPAAVTNGILQIDVQGVVKRGLLNGIHIVPATPASPASPPALKANPASLNFTATAGGANPAAQAVTIVNAGSGSLNWTAASSQPWLVVSPPSGSGAGGLSVQAMTAGLAAGVYTGSITVNGPGATSQPATVAVKFTVGGPPTSTQPSGTSSLNIDCGGPAYTAADGSQWIADRYFTGGDLLYTSSLIQNTPDLPLYRSARAGLYGDFTYSIPVTNGSYIATLQFAEIQYTNKGDRVFNVILNGSQVLSNFDILTQTAPLTVISLPFPVTVTNGTVEIAVQGVVRRGVLNGIKLSPANGQTIAPPVLGVSTSSLSFSGAAGGANPSAQKASLSNTGSGTLNWTAAVDQSWLTVSPAAGTGPATISIQTNIAGLAGGSYSGTVTISAAGASGSPKTIAVGLTLATPAPSPALTVSPASLSFSGVVNGPAPAAKTLSVTNSGNGSMSWNASDNQPWLTVSPASGTNSGSISIQPNLTGLSQGTYSATVAVVAPGASGSPKTIAVSLTVAAAPATTLTAAPSAISFSASAGSSNPAAQTVTIGSTGGSSSWSCTKTKPWLTVSQASGTGPAAISVDAQIAGMTAGTYADTLTIAGPAGTTPATVNVTLSIAGSTPPPSGSGNNWYVSPSGSSSGNGSIGSPWDIVTAFQQPSSVKPGDTIWLRAGKYGDGTSGAVLASNLVGTASAPIVVRAYPGERAIIDAWLQVGCCDQAPNPSKGAYTWFWGVEFASYNPDRSSGTSGPPEWAHQANHAAVDTWAPGTKLINCIVHDTSMGIEMWDEATNSDAYGNLVYNVGGYGTDRGHGHGFYLQNEAPSVKHIFDNITFNNFGNGFQIYGSGSAYVQNFDVEGNVSFNNGTLALGSNTANGTASAGPRTDNMLFAEGNGGPKGMVLKNNYLYHTPDADDGYSELGYLWTPRANDLVATGNYFMGGIEAADVYRWDSVVFQNNVVYSKHNTESNLIYRDDQDPHSYQWNNNQYYGSGRWVIMPGCDGFPCNNSTGYDFAGWKAATGLDANSTFTPGAPTGVWTFVRPNTYEPGRANIVIYNWDLRSNVQVDLSNSGIKTGDTYQIRDGENFFGAPVASGTYNGQPVTIPMTGLQVALPFGVVPNPQPHTAPQFGVFILLSGSSLH